MRFSDVFLSLFRFLLSPALIGTVYLYFYPFLHGCDFPEARHAEAACYFGDDKRAAVPGEKAPFRLLALGDPQLEGDTSLPGRGRAEAFPSWKRIWNGIERDGLGTLSSSLSREGKRLWEEDLPKVLKTYHKKLDLWGNDLYLAHIYRTMSWYTDPTHVAVLGDLLGSQWISDEEFASRSNRFWNTVFRGGQKVPRTVTDTSSTQAEILRKDKAWKNRIIAIAGNHDIGYAGDIDEHRVERFEDEYGRVNWEVRFALNETTKSSGLQQSRPELRLVILNSMNLDEPYVNYGLHQNSHDFMKERLYWQMPPADIGTILLTHIPLHKPRGICVDGPFFDYFPEDQGGGIKEQNHLSRETSELILDGLNGPERGRKAIILNGHDHAGCDTYHSRPKEIDIEAFAARAPEDDWEAQHYSQAGPRVTNSSLTGLREVTVRSMMGEFGGNAGLLSAWWDKETQEWKFDYASCMVGVQHIWWAVHVLDIIVLGLGILGVLCAVIEELSRPETTAEKKQQ